MFEVFGIPSSALFGQLLSGLISGSLYALLSVGLAVIFGMLNIINFAHGAQYMMGAFAAFLLLDKLGVGYWPALVLVPVIVGAFGIVMERLILRRLAGNEQGQVLVTLGVAFIIADICLLVWTGDPMPLPAPPALRPPLRVGGFAFPTYRLVVLAIALFAALALYLLMERTRLGAMIRAGVDDMEMARGVGIPVSRLFTTVFLLGAALAGIGGVLGGPILNAYPGLDTDMLPLALIVVILGGAGSLLGAFVGSFIVGFIYNFGIALVPDLAYFVLFLPMVLVLVFLPQGLFGRVQI